MQDLQDFIKELKHNYDHFGAETKTGYIIERLQDIYNTELGVLQNLELQLKEAQEIIKKNK